MNKKFDRALILLSEWSDDDGEQFLVQTARTGWWELPWRDRAEGETYRDAVAAELSVRFQLNPKRDFIVCSTPRLNLILHPRTMELLDRADVDQDGFGVVEVYPVQLFGSRSREQLATQRGCQWWSGGQFARDQLTPQTATAVHAMRLGELAE